jgi:hypothetical protein
MTTIFKFSGKKFAAERAAVGVFLSWAFRGASREGALGSRPFDLWLEMRAI